MKIIKKVRNIIPGGLLYILYQLSSTKCKELINEDIAAYNRKNTKKINMIDLVFEESKRTFRNVLYYRFKSDNCNERLLKICRILIPQIETIEIGGEIDGGLKIIHNYCVISVEKAGKNFTVLQGVTIGKNIDGGKPNIGDNVIVYPNSTIFGKIKIGNDVKIGAGSVVNKNIPDCSVVIGNPAKIIRTDG